MLMIIPYAYIKIHKGVSHPLLHVLPTTALGGGQSRGKRSYSPEGAKLATDS